MTETAVTVAGPLRRRSADALTAATAACLVAAAFVRFGVGAHGLVAAFFLAVLVALTRIDLERRILPNRIVLPAAGLVLAAQLALFPDRAVEWLVAPLLAFGLLLVPVLVNPAALGLGDVKLMLLFGAALGFSVFNALLLGFLLVLPVALVILARGGMAARKRAIPFGPFLAGGAVLATLFG